MKMLNIKGHKTEPCGIPHKTVWWPGLGSSTVDQVLKYIKYPKYIPSTSTGQVLIYLKST